MTNVWRGFRGLPLFLQAPIGVIAGLFGIGLVAAPFTSDTAEEQATTTVPTTTT